MTTQKWRKIMKNRECRETGHLQRGTQKSEALENLGEREREREREAQCCLGWVLGVKVRIQDSVGIYRTLKFNFRARLRLSEF